MNTLHIKQSSEKIPMLTKRSFSILSKLSFQLIQIPICAETPYRFRDVLQIAMSKENILISVSNNTVDMAYSGNTISFLQGFSVIKAKKCISFGENSSDIVPPDTNHINVPQHFTHPITKQGFHLNEDLLHIF